MENSPLTFKVSNTVLSKSYPPRPIKLNKFLSSSRIVRNSGKLLKTTEPVNAVAPDLGNGFVGAAFRAYNDHYRLILRPDDVWIAVTTALSSYIDKNAIRMQSIFVNHEGKKELVVNGIGSIHTADYDRLIDAMSTEIDKNTKDDIRTWIECDFTTSTKLSRTVSKIVLMGAMKHYFSYKMCLCCGLPAVTLEGTIDDWRTIRSRVDKMATWNEPTLTSWSQVLGHVLDHFVDAFQGKIDTDWWNRIAHKTGGGSGPDYLEGWILAFIPFTDQGDYVLNSLENILTSKAYGKMDTNDVPLSSVEVPVTIDDNGTLYKTLFYGGLFVCKYKVDTIRPSLDWALIDVTDC